MSEQLVKRVSQSLVPVGEEWKAYLQIADVWVASGMLPTHVKTPQQALAIMLAARDLGLKHTAAFKGLFLTNGKIQMEFQTMLALALSKLPEMEFQVMERTNAGCAVRGRRNPRQEWQQARFDAKDALAADLLGKETWKKYAPDMYYAKAGTRLLRIMAADVLMGLAYDQDEMEEIGKTSPAGSVTIAQEDVIDISGAEEIKDAEIINEPIEEANKS